jgi:hypothetical protein
MAVSEDFRPPESIARRASHFPFPRVSKISPKTNDLLTFWAVLIGKKML